METKEVLFTVMCEEETELAKLRDLKDLKTNLIGSQYRIRGEVENYEEDISGYPSMSFSVYVRGDFDTQDFKKAIDYFSGKVHFMSLAAWCVGWEGDPQTPPDDNEKTLIASFQWNVHGAKILERRWDLNRKAVNVHVEDFTSACCVAAI